jgi:hypothetical protein
MHDKFELYARESYFRESWQTATDVLGSEMVPLLQRVAALTLRPETVLSRRAGRALRYMTDHGFTPLLAVPVQLTPASAREIWRYQWNAATLDRLALGDVINTSAGSVMLFFRDDRSDPGLPGSVRLAGLKGSALPWERSERHLRTVLGGINRLIVMVHCSDEPIDIVRELGILIGSRRLDTVYERLWNVFAGLTAASVCKPITRTYVRCPAQSLGVDAAVESVLDRLAHGPRAGRAGRSASRAAAALRAATDGATLSWRAWSRDLRAAGIDPTGWNVALAASHHIRPVIDGAAGIISDSGRKHWLAGEGLLIPGPPRAWPRAATTGSRLERTG